MQIGRHKLCIILPDKRFPNKTESVLRKTLKDLYRDDGEIGDRNMNHERSKWERRQRQQKQLKNMIEMNSINL